MDHIVNLCQELTLVVRSLDDGNVCYDIRPWRWIITREALSSLQQGYKIQGKQLLHAFHNSQCQLRALGLVESPQSLSQDGADGAPHLELLVRDRSTGQARYLSRSLPAQFGKAELEKLADACNDNGCELLHAFIGNQCKAMEYFVG